MTRGAPGPGVVVHRDKQLLADAAAARLVTSIVDAQASRGRAHVVLTGGSMGSAILESLGRSAARDAIDWPQLDIWWGDERFLPAGDPERNETQARAALLDAVHLDPARVHPMPALDGPDGPDVDAAAARYARELADAAGRGEDVPAFDVLMLGVGPDAHVASLFPEHPALHERRASTVGVRGAPKPPPVRVSLTFPALVRGRATSGSSSPVPTRPTRSAWPCPAPARCRRRRPASPAPAPRPWLLDRDAAAHVPRALVRPASP